MHNQWGIDTAKEAQRGRCRQSFTATSNQSKFIEKQTTFGNYNTRYSKIVHNSAAQTLLIEGVSVSSMCQCLTPKHVITFNYAIFTNYYLCQCIRRVSVRHQARDHIQPCHFHKWLLVSTCVSVRCLCQFLIAT